MKFRLGRSLAALTLLALATLSTVQPAEARYPRCSCGWCEADPCTKCDLNSSGPPNLIACSSYLNSPLCNGGPICLAAAPGENAPDAHADDLFPPSTEPAQTAAETPAEAPPIVR